MDDLLYMVIWRPKSGGKWRAEPEGVFEGPSAERLAHNWAECLNSRGTYEYRVVRGPIVSAETMAEVEARLGAF
jgi:hypothetical protein